MAMTTNTNVPAVWQDLVTDVSRTSTAGPLYQVGQVREENGVRYRYVKNGSASGSVAAAAGQIAYINSLTDPFNCTPKASEAAFSGSNSGMGFWVAATPQNGWGWIQVRGYMTNIACATPSAGDALITGTSTDGRTATVAGGTAPTNKVLAWAHTAGSSNLCNGFVVAE